MDLVTTSVSTRFIIIENIENHQTISQVSPTSLIMLTAQWKSVVPTNTNFTSLVLVGENTKENSTIGTEL